ncbi:hypothetical protein LINGRAHAP2_LOCUS9953 [Linum grandiflorum]
MHVWIWDGHGLGQPEALRVLSDLTTTHHHDVVVLLETLTNKARVEEVRLELEFERCVVVEAVGHSGGLAILWRFANQGMLLHYQCQCITIEQSTHNPTSHVVVTHPRK